MDAGTEAGADAFRDASTEQRRCRRRRSWDRRNSTDDAPVAEVLVFGTNTTKKKPEPKAETQKTSTGTPEPRLQDSRHGRQNSNADEASPRSPFESRALPPSSMAQARTKPPAGTSGQWPETPSEQRR